MQALGTSQPPRGVFNYNSAATNSSNNVIPLLKILVTSQGIHRRLKWGGGALGLKPPSIFFAIPTRALHTGQKSYIAPQSSHPSSAYGDTWNKMNSFTSSFLSLLFSFHPSPSILFFPLFCCHSCSESWTGAVLIHHT